MFSRKQMIKLLAPLIAEQIMAVLVGMVDVVMVAAVGESAVSGVSLVDSISVLIIQIMGALATGGAVISAQYLGKEQPRDARKAAGQLVLVTLLLSVIIAGTALAGGRHLLGGIFGKVEQDVMDNAQTYFWITALSYPFIGLYNACAALFRSMGNSKVSMMTSFVMNMINIIGNAICVFGLKMGVAGVAWPTLISRVTAAFMMFVLIQNRNNTIRLNSWKFLIPDRHMIKNILSIGIPNGLENGMFQAGKLVVLNLIATFGTSAVAANAIANSIAGVVNVPGTAIGLSIITVIGRCMGAGETGQAAHYTKRLVGASYVCMLVMSTGMFLFADTLVSWFNLTPQAVQMAGQVLRACAVGNVLFWPMAFTLPNSLRAAGDAVFTMGVSLCSMFACRVALSYVMACEWGLGLGLLGVWLAMIADWVARAVLFFVRYRQGKWKKIKVIG